jgi:uncharacterized Fe-S radical SAM superfamily protein PflX
MGLRSSVSEGTPSTWPAYLGLLETGELRRRVEHAVALLGEGRLCPRDCGSNRLAERLAAEMGFCRAPDYPERAAAAISEMHRQVGDLELDGRGVARRGLLVRHLVMPNRVAGTAEVVRFLAGLSPRLFAKVMDQYRPCYGAVDDPVIGRRPTREEVREALNEAREAGLRGPYSGCSQG